MLPSGPRSDKRTIRFRPLAGISCFKKPSSSARIQIRFRPLAGISCFSLRPDAQVWDIDRFRPLAGISCFLRPDAQVWDIDSFRPLAGISCFSAEPVETVPPTVFVP